MVKFLVVRFQRRKSLSLPIYKPELSTKNNPEVARDEQDQLSHMPIALPVCSTVSMERTRSETSTGPLLYQDH